MTHYFLSRSTRFCKTNDGIVFLNLKLNRYFGLAVEQTRLLPSLISGWPPEPFTGQATIEVNDQNISSLAQSLTDKGILTGAIDQARKPVPEQIRSARDLETVPEAINPLRRNSRHLFTFLYCLIWVGLLLKFSNLESITHRLATTNEMLDRNAVGVDDSHVCGLVNIFKIFRPWAYKKVDNCLFDSLVLAKFLQLCGIQALFVIGISTRPFAAHAWVQYRDIVLNEFIERVDGLTPIIAA